MNAVSLSTFQQSHSHSHSVFSVMRTCSKGARCISNANPLTADNFRKASSGPRSVQFFKTCNHCRKRPPCPLIRENLQGQSLCSSCKVERSAQDFLDSNGIVFFLIHTECKATRWPPVGFVKSISTLPIHPRFRQLHR
jgi:hypothetical protein